MYSSPFLCCLLVPCCFINSFTRPPLLLCFSKLSHNIQTLFFILPAPGEYLLTSSLQMSKRKAAEMTSQTLTDEEIARILRALTDSEEAEQQQQAAVAPISNQGSPTLEPGQNCQGVNGFQADVAGSQTQDFSFPAVNSAFTQDDNTGHQDVPPQGQVSHSSSGS